MKLALQLTRGRCHERFLSLRTYRGEYTLVGEELRPFEAIAAFDDTDAVNALDDTNDSTILVVFVHQITRPSIGLIRLLMEFAASKEKEGLESRLVFLTADVTETTAYLN